MVFHFLSSRAVYLFSSTPLSKIHYKKMGGRESTEEFVHGIYQENFLLGIAVWLNLDTRDTGL